ncbi:MAG: rhodanese-like domain-containing protein, partial [Acidimicrobiia bacterium]
TQYSPTSDHAHYATCLRTALANNLRLSPPRTRHDRLSKGSEMDIDVLPDREYNESHIPGAISLPLRHLTSETVSVRRRDKPVVVY